MVMGYAWTEIEVTLVLAVIHAVIFLGPIAIGMALCGKDEGKN